MAAPARASSSCSPAKRSASCFSRSARALEGVENCSFQGTAKIGAPSSSARKSHIALRDCTSQTHVHPELLRRVA